MKGIKLTYLATADARGHLMRAQLLTHALRADGATVDVLTTSDEGVDFLARFGIEATVLSRHYAVQFDTHQNMLRGATDANVANYVFRPTRMWRDIWRLRRVLRDADLVINDSFHPALLCMGCLPGWRGKVVHVYGASLRHALETNFSGRVPGLLSGLFHRVIALQINASLARLEHDFCYIDEASGGATFRLPTPVAIAAPAEAEPGATPRAAVYLNPHFRDPALADALTAGLEGAGVSAQLVGEGYAGRGAWRAQDPDWVHGAAVSDLIVSAPGMAALSVALVYRRPIVLVLTEQPEQQSNAARAAALGLAHRVVVWRGDAAAFGAEVRQAGIELLAQARSGAGQRCGAGDGHNIARARLDSWVSVLQQLAAGRRRT